MDDDLTIMIYGAIMGAAGTIALPVFGGGVLVFSFAALPGFLFTKRVIRAPWG